MPRDRPPAGLTNAPDASFYRSYDAAFTGTRPKLRLGDPGIDVQWMRRRLWGSLVAGTWSGFVLPLIGLGLMSHWGPFGRLDSWQLETFGSNSLILLAILFFPLIFVPRVITAVMPINRSTPFLLGMRQAYDRDWGPKIEGYADSPSHFRKVRRACLVVTIVGVTAIVVAIAYGVYDASRPRAPLPQLSLARLADPSAPLPSAARVIGAVPDLSQRWNYHYNVRQDIHHDVYYPLRAPGERADVPAKVVELDQTSPQSEVASWNMVNAPGPREGTLSVMGDWEAGEMQHAGVKLAAHVTLLTREQLHGKMPDQGMTGFFIGLFGFVATLLGGALYWSFGRAAKLAAARPRGDFNRI
ncbi:hypothetical protein [Sphingomonas sp.]|uniref:hypothetical protein n=1 Tax=Sphingomonas sp. TaxID=28214 RepID=UPI003B3A9AD8